MKKVIATTLLAGIASLPCSAEINVIPKPNQVVKKTDADFIFKDHTAIRYDKRLENEAKLLAASIKEATGIKPRLFEETLKINTPSQIYLDIKEGKNKEAYTLVVTPAEVKIEGEDAAGAFYGSQTLLQLIPVEGDAIVPGCKIADKPRFGWRGMHLDVGRHFFGVDKVKKFIDQLAFHKMNSFHWHLTEDQGWRIEIKKYPKLTEIGGFRDSTPPYLDRWGSDGKRYGGFYTQEQIKEVVAYAAERHINVVPEIDMPGHMAAAITAYPHLGNDDIPNYNPKVQCVWGVHPYVLAPKEETFKFVDDVLEEVCQLFPSKYIHIGGDEAPKGQWKKSKFAQSVIKREGLKNEYELQSYFIKRLEKMLEKRGRKLIGWDEIREGGLSPNATMMLWRGWEHAIKSVEEGHDVVMAPGSHTYFDHYQNHSTIELAKGKEFEAIGGFRPMNSVYSFNPVPEQFRGSDKEKHILGCQGQLWTEYMKTWEKVEYMAFPRLSALAEVAWTEVANKDYTDFEKRLQPMLVRYQKAGINHFNPADFGKIKTVHGAKLATNLHPHGANVVELAYDGNEQSFFWSNEGPKAGDYVTLSTDFNLGGSTIKVTTGKEKDGKFTDFLAEGVLQASKDGKIWTEIAVFKDGEASGVAPEDANKIRIMAKKSQNSWLVIRDILITK